MRDSEIIEYIKTHNLIGLKAGEFRTTFLEIWMVVVNDRIFARSWGFAEKSWYNTFLSDSNGQLKCGETVFNIKAVIPDDLIKISEQINNAYLEKYDSGSNSKYAHGIIKQKHIEKTMEFIITE
ncbi:hypothetical protein SAMN05444397_1082 [Flavobacterium aquidurense]|uniref:DUF2255 family protein n=1 Tax=Flavobacterium frigidimaris TaxID=262320 RepID=A0ABX4BQS1_FLAFR|nr:DUF2255 family protein [Flavobacterium frigidimaris]OXA78961.1 hypothetical protein B0A65_12295 [Flavobacterium frigidimaris]SDZ50665.1 hypothetical protein SAMN05444397_1082 [Flavobacterium aquidurense]